MDFFTKKCLDTIQPYLNGEVSSCSYCDHLDSLILLEGKYTYITIAIGQIVEGYLQVCSQKHRTSATGLLPHERAEFEIMKETVRQSYIEVYGNSGIAFEHGQAGSCMYKKENKNSLCHHTHTHFVPVDIDITKEIHQILPEKILVRNISELVEVRKDELEGGAYLYFENSDKDGFVFPVEGYEIPRQFLRTCVAEKLGIKHRADWITYPGIEYFKLTKVKMESILKKNFFRISKMKSKI